MILRSRATSEQAHAVEHPAVRETIAAWERRLDDAHRAGHAAGLAEADAKIVAAQASEARAQATEIAIKADYEQRLGLAISALADGTAHLDQLAGQLIRTAEADVARLALLIAARLLHREVEDDPTWMEAVLADALARVPDKRGIAVRMHPADAEAATERKRFILEQAPGVERLEFFADEALPRGACIIASQGTRLDASLPSSWERLARDILIDPREPLAIHSDGTPAPVDQRPGEQIEGTKS